jgi:hypothetical protein
MPKQEADTPLPRSPQGDATLSMERSALDERSVVLTRIAALAASDASPTLVRTEHAALQKT